MVRWDNNGQVVRAVDEADAQDRMFKSSGGASLYSGYSRDDFVVEKVSNNLGSFLIGT
tara:strand:- start:328 stop:501 length:174 start_codon:yes stop_codon:yes gene_type:complete